MMFRKIRKTFDIAWALGEELPWLVKLLLSSGPEEQDAEWFATHQQFIEQAKHRAHLTQAEADAMLEEDCPESDEVLMERIRRALAVRPAPWSTDPSSRLVKDEGRWASWAERSGLDHPSRGVDFGRLSDDEVAAIEKEWRR